MPQSRRAQSAPPTEAAKIAAASTEPAAWAAAPPAGDDTPIYMSEQPEAEMPDTAPQDADVESHDVGDHNIYERFGRLQHRALRHQIETGSPLPEPTDTSPSAVFAAPTDAADADEAVHTAPAAEPTTDEPMEDRRKVDDPNFPSIFDRRGGGPAPRRSGFPRFGDDLPVDHSVGHDIPSIGADEGEDSEHSGEPSAISTPAEPAAEDMGEAVGFNPDFDVNPFR